MKRHATAVWQGTGKEGKGTLTTQSNVLNEAQYSFGTRFEDGIGTNPEELVAAAHAGCFAMKLAFLVSGEDLAAENIDTRCVITLEGGAITNSHLTVKASVPGLSQEKFEVLLAEAEEGCLISNLLNTEITVEGQLI